MELRLEAKTEQTVQQKPWNIQSKGALYSQDRNSARWDHLFEEIPLIFQDPQVLEGIAGILEEKNVKNSFWEHNHLSKFEEE